MSEKKRRVLSAVLICLCIATVAFIWGNSMLGSKASSNVSNSVLGALDPIIRRFGIVSKDDLWLRKLAHFTEFAALGAELLFLAARLSETPRVCARKRSDRRISFPSGRTILKE